MSGRRVERHRNLGRVLAASALTATLAFAAVSCGDDGDSDATSGGVPATDGSTGATSSSGGDAANGEQLSRSKGCAGCHGQDFGGGAGPGWIGLAGSDVVLVGGETVLADTAYLTRAIADPAADLVEDYNLKMPANSLSDAEIADIVAFIETLTDG